MRNEVYPGDFGVVGAAQFDRIVFLLPVSIKFSLGTIRIGKKLKLCEGRGNPYTIY